MGRTYAASAAPAIGGGRYRARSDDERRGGRPACANRGSPNLSVVIASKGHHAYEGAGASRWGQPNVAWEKSPPFVCGPPHISREAQVDALDRGDQDRRRALSGVARPAVGREQGGEVDARPREHRRPEIAELLEARGDVVDPEVFDLDVALDLLPRHRRRDGRARVRADRVDRRERAAPGVLVVVDEHAPHGRVRLRVDRGKQPRVATRDLGRQALGERPHLVLRRSAHDRDVHVDAARAGRLRVARHPERVERLADNQRGLADLRERRPRRGVEIEVQVVGATTEPMRRNVATGIDCARALMPSSSRSCLA